MRFTIFFFSIGILAQTNIPLSVGFKIGSPVNNPTNFGFTTTTTQSRWTGGPTVELRLPFNFAVEFDALYRTGGATSTYAFPLGLNLNPYNYTSRETTDTWDLPLLLKYRFQVGPVHPFVSAGYMWSHESSAGSAYYNCSGPASSCRPPDYPGNAPIGGSFNNSFDRRSVAAGAGLEFRTHYVTITPEARYSRPVNGHPKENRVTGLVGFTFGKKR